MREDYIKLGYLENDIENELREFKCFTKKGNINETYSNNELLNLLSKYDCSNVRIGILVFYENVEETDNYYILGEAETDLLTLNKVTLEIQVLDYTNTDYVIYNCASNGENFMDALLLAANLFSNRIKDLNLAFNEYYTYEFVVACSSKAGGDKYLDFYKVLLGCDS
ncbi:hypothetical protein [Polluticaenibacter yanchengensis]|uniref:Uncharacterized protein n=1 Tax=Polluticaenibacter yanchengensis TaxID=3014562 RepID=A0ABT4UNE6_9BACT|nr:hypothetical protein [Chitinophagaceae bacterium LY-5]